LETADDTTHIDDSESTCIPKAQEGEGKEEREGKELVDTQHCDTAATSQPLSLTPMEGQSLHPDSEAVSSESYILLDLPSIVCISESVHNGIIYLSSIIPKKHTIISCSHEERKKREKRKDVCSLCERVHFSRFLQLCSRSLHIQLKSIGCFPVFLSIKNIFDEVLSASVQLAKKKLHALFGHFLFPESEGRSIFIRELIAIENAHFMGSVCVGGDALDPEDEEVYAEDNLKEMEKEAEEEEKKRDEEEEEAYRGNTSTKDIPASSSSSKCSSKATVDCSSGEGDPNDPSKRISMAVTDPLSHPALDKNNTSGSPDSRKEQEGGNPVVDSIKTSAPKDSRALSLSAKVHLIQHLLQGHSTLVKDCSSGSTNSTSGSRLSLTAVKPRSGKIAAPSSILRVWTKKGEFDIPDEVWNGIILDDVSISHNFMKALEIIFCSSICLCLITAPPAFRPALALSIRNMVQRGQIYKFNNELLRVCKCVKDCPLFDTIDPEFIEMGILLWRALEIIFCSSICLCLITAPPAFRPALALSIRNMVQRGQIYKFNNELLRVCKCVKDCPLFDTIDPEFIEMGILLWRVKRYYGVIKKQVKKEERVSVCLEKEGGSVKQEKKRGFFSWFSGK
ncbi:hypothetical protein ADUPG1_007234, partial [Aduncisulcus paluster]